MNGEVELLKAMPEFGNGPEDDQGAPVWCDVKDGSCENKREEGGCCGQC